MRYRLACARVYLGDYSNWTGWAYRDEWAFERNFLPHDIPRWRGENVDSLLCMGEQGLGDQILFASCLPECMVRVKRVVYACDRRLIAMLERSLPGLRCIDQDMKPTEDFDAFIPAADLLPLFRKRRADFPAQSYLRSRHVDALLHESLGRYSGKIGIGWAGRQGSIDPLKLGLDSPLSLQHDAAHPQIEAPPIDLHDDLEAVLSLVTCLSRVVCVPSTIHHIAGAAGVKVDVIWPESGPLEPEALNQVPWSHPPGRLPWYPNVTVYRSIKEWKAARASDAG